MLSNLNTNMKILIGISSITILGIIYAFIKNMFKPKNKMIEGQTTLERTGISAPQGKNNINPDLILNEVRESSVSHIIAIESLKKTLTGIGHKYASINLENIFPTNIRKTIIHLSSIDIHNHIDIDKYPHEYDMGHTTFDIPVFKKVINIKLIGALIPYVPHNIYDGNDTLKIGTESAVIEEGYYTIHTLINEINSQCTKVTLTFNNITKKIKITNISAPPFTLFKNGVSGKLFRKLGFNTSSESVPMGINGSLTGDFIPDLSIHYIDVIMDENHPSGDSQTFNRPILKRIPLDGSPGDMIYYDMPYSDYKSQQNFSPDINTDLLSKISITLFRNDATEYNLNGLHYDLKLEITEMIDATLYDDLKALKLTRLQLESYGADAEGNLL